MILNIIFSLLNIISLDSLLVQYNKIVEKNIATLLGEGELKFTETFSGKEFYLFESETINNGAIVVFSSAKGRFENFDYMVTLNKSHQIIDIRILKYRSAYGYEISGKGWLKQFYNKPVDKFVYKKNIDSVSGATFSAQSLVNDVNFILDHLKHL